MPGKRQRWQHAYDQLSEETKQQLVDSYAGMLTQQVYDIDKGELVTVWAIDLTRATTGYIWAYDVWKARHELPHTTSSSAKRR